MSVLRKLLKWFRGGSATPEELQAVQEARFDHETMKTGSFDAPPMMQGHKWPRP